jgi:N-methylhydantoinase A
MSLDLDAAERAISDRVAGPLGMSVAEAAAGILRLSNAAMLDGIRLMTTQRGHDPREFALVAFGGAGALQAPDLAREIGIRRIVVPRLPGLMSARGILEVNVRHDLLEPLFQRGSSIDRGRVLDAVRTLERKSKELMARDTSVEDWHLEWQADIRYFGQISGYLTMPMPDGNPVGRLDELVARFGERHAREFGYELPASVAEAEIVNLRTALVGEVGKPPEPAFTRSRSDARTRTVPVWFTGEGRLDAQCLDRDAIEVGTRIAGPAIVTEWDSTAIVPPLASAWVEPTGDLVIELDRDA